MSSVKKIRRVGRELLVYLLLAAGITAVMVGFMGLPEAGRLPAIYLINLGISVGIGLTLDTMYRVVLPRFGLDAKEKLGFGAFVAHGIGILFAMPAAVYVTLYGVRFLFPDTARYFPYDSVVRVAIPVSIGMVAISEIIGRWRQRAMEAERERLRAELDAIQARVNPHFLFNSLNTIAALVHEDADRAEAAVLELSGLLRHSLEDAKQRWVSLEREVEAAKSYLAFEKLRFGDRLQTTFEIETPAGIDVPPLVLQPLVENAVKHGIRRREGGQVHVKVSADEDVVRFVVEDDGDGSSEEEGTATGEQDLRRRLELLYDSGAFVETDRGPLGGYRVRLTLPRTHD